MQNNLIIRLVSSFSLICLAVAAFADDARQSSSQPANGSVRENTNIAGNATLVKPKQVIAGKLVDINGAKRKELMKLPGIGKAEADRIMAGRPYATKAHLVTQNVIGSGQFEKIRKLIVARQPYKDGANNAALYSSYK